MRTVVVLLAVVVLLGVYISWTAGRIDRLHVRVEAARAALDAQLVRRAAVAHELALSPSTAARLAPADRERLHEAAHAALAASPARPGVLGREAVENDLSRALHIALDGLRAPDTELGRLLAELDAAAVRTGFARQFHNDAVRDTRTLRGRRLPRLLRLAGTAPLPPYFEIDDTVLPTQRLAAA